MSDNYIRPEDANIDIGLYFKAKPHNLDWLINNELPLGIAMNKNSFFQIASKQNFEFSELTGFDLFRAPIFSKTNLDFNNFDLTKVYRVIYEI